MQYTYRYRIVRVAPLEMFLYYFGAHEVHCTIHLQDRRLQVLLDNDILRSELTRLRTEYPYDAFEASNDDFIHRWVCIVDVAHAD